MKGEIGGCDLVALSDDETPIVVIGELKLSFNLELVLQAVHRAGAGDEVLPDGAVTILVAPDAPMPRKDPRRRSRLVSEHRRRQGDPAVGGGSRVPVMTAYRQQALACAAVLAAGPARPRDLRPRAPDAGKILRDNVYGWFARTERGVYALTPAGHEALARWPQAVVEPSV